MDVKVSEQVPWRARGGRGECFTTDVVGSVVIGNNECKQMVMGVDGGSGGSEGITEQGGGVPDVKAIRSNGRCAGRERDVRAKLWHCPGERQVTSMRRGRTWNVPRAGASGMQVGSSAWFACSRKSKGDTGHLQALGMHRRGAITWGLAGETESSGGS